MNREGEHMGAGPMDYEVAFVDQDELPDGHDWLLAHLPDRVMVFMRRDRVTPRLIEEAWAAYRHLVRCDPLAVAV